MHGIITRNPPHLSYLIKWLPVRLYRFQTTILGQLSAIVQANQRLDIVLVLNMKLSQEHPHLELVVLDDKMEHLDGLVDHQQAI